MLCCAAADQSGDPSNSLDNGHYTVLDNSLDDGYYKEITDRRTQSLTNQRIAFKRAVQMLNSASEQWTQGRAYCHTENISTLSTKDKKGKTTKSLYPTTTTLQRLPACRQKNHKLSKKGKTTTSHTQTDVALTTQTPAKYCTSPHGCLSTDKPPIVTSQLLYCVTVK